MTKVIESVLMRLGVPNANGRIYPDNEATRKVIADFAKRVDSGKAFCEAGNPYRTTKLTSGQDICQLVREIDLTRVAARITKLDLSVDGVLTADIVPYGPMKDAVFLENHKIQMGFRGFYKKNKSGGISELLEIVAFDFIGLGKG